MTSSLILYGYKIDTQKPFTFDFGSVATCTKGASFSTQKLLASLLTNYQKLFTRTFQPKSQGKNQAFCNEKKTFLFAFGRVATCPFGTSLSTQKQKENLTWDQIIVLLALKLLNKVKATTRNFYRGVKRRKKVIFFLSFRVLISRFLIFCQ